MPRNAGRRPSSCSTRPVRLKPTDPSLRLVDPTVYADHGHRLPAPLDRRAPPTFSAKWRVWRKVWTRARRSRRSSATRQRIGREFHRQVRVRSPPLVSLVEILRRRAGRLRHTL
ncbi:MAG: hypothetical protein R2851_24835 [Caldilineaceae bacterium]